MKFCSCRSLSPLFYPECCGPRSRLDFVVIHITRGAQMSGDWIYYYGAWFLIFSLEFASYYLWRLAFETRLRGFGKVMHPAHTHAHTCYGLNDLGFESLQRETFLQNVQPGSAGRPSSCSLAAGVSFPGAKQPARDVDHCAVRSSVRVTRSKFGHCSNLCSLF